MNNELIEKTIAYVKEFFKNDFSGHDFWHTLRVHNTAKSIAEKEECDKELVCLGALLHDVDDVKLVLKSLNNEISYDINYSLDDSVLDFHVSNFINDGIYLDDIPVEDYFMFLKIHTKKQSIEWNV